MKIYPNDSKIMVTNNVNTLTDIPLSYVDTQRLDYKINTIIESNFKNKIKQEVLPYDKMNKNIICLFDKYGNQLDPVELTKHFKRENNDYIFMPYGSVAFSPKFFEYSITAKKNVIYNSKMQYNLNVCIANDMLANILMPIFGDAPNKNLAPSNILINNGSMSYSDLATSSMKGKDIVFALMASLEEDAMGNKYDLSKPLESNTNTFAFMSEAFAQDVAEDTIFKRKSNIEMFKFNKTIRHTIKNPKIYDSAEIESDMFFTVPIDSENIKYHNLFNSDKVPVLLEEHEGKGFVIYAINSITHNIAKYSKLMYEIMFYIYAKSYSRTINYREWITDKMPDFVVVNNKLTKKEKFVSQLELHKMLGLNEYEVTPYKVNINEEIYPFVKFTGMSNSYLTFEKDISDSNEIYKDPVNEKGDISIFTSRQNMIYFEEFLYKIDDSLDENIKVERINNVIKITVKPFRHSSSGIFIKSLSNIEIPLSYRDEMNTEIQITNADFYIVCKQNESASYLEYKDALKYTKGDGLILATIQVRQSETTTLVYDMRQRGGGLPESEKDNFNCFDIGHIYGRPYRKGGSFIITLPGKLKAHKAIIEQTVKQYCAAEEYPIIIFKED